MSTPPNKTTANTNSTTAENTIQTAADQTFIDDATLAINQAIAQGQFSVTLNVQDPCSLQAIHDYFVGLGYAVLYPGLGMASGMQPIQPAELFGSFWDQFWMGMNVPPVPLPARIILFWK